MTKERRNRSGPAAYDWLDAGRGYWAKLKDGERTVTLTEGDVTLSSMLRAGVLVGQAKEDAEALIVLTPPQMQRPELVRGFASHIRVVESPPVPLGRQWRCWGRRWTFE